MIRVRFRTLELAKLYPLRISRGTMPASDNLFVFASDGEHEGVGELSPATGKNWSATRGQAQLEAYCGEGLSDASIHENWARMQHAGIDPPAMAALDMALWDLFGKQCGQPLHRVFGLSRAAVPTSVTIGLNEPEVTRERIPDILRRTGAKCLKIKLGAPEGREFDKAHFSAAAEAAAPFAARLRVDANGGWTPSEAPEMMRWLAERNVDYVEQPLAEGEEAALPAIFEGRALPIFVDESCRFATDIPAFAHCVDGINLKLMKCGGLTEALRIIATARAFHLKTMIGCMSESSIAIGAGAALGQLMDHIDLDSHLNLDPDPARGAPIADGVVRASSSPGHGAELIDA